MGNYTPVYRADQETDSEENGSVSCHSYPYRRGNGK